MGQRTGKKELNSKNIKNIKTNQTNKQKKKKKKKKKHNKQTVALRPKGENKRFQCPEMFLRLWYMVRGRFDKSWCIEWVCGLGVLQCCLCRLCRKSDEIGRIIISLKTGARSFGCWHVARLLFYSKTECFTSMNMNFLKLEQGRELRFTSTDTTCVVVFGEVPSRGSNQN